jgi:glycosyltransferase involved in cell wall biosynthesis
LWRNGHLGGREVTVLMTRLPLSLMHSRLDRAYQQHPERRTLGDFRAPACLVEAEAAALDYADRIVTPHAELAHLYPGKTAELYWEKPVAKPSDRLDPAPRRIAFPGPTVARKGAYELREAARALDLEILCLGNELEGTGFWEGIGTRRPDTAAAGAWLPQVAAVVQPALVEERPRHLLAALAAGIPIVATEACGIAAAPGVTIVPAGNTQALIAALSTVLKQA